MEAKSSDAVCASGGSGAASVSSGSGVADGFLLRPINAVDQANDGRCQKQCAGEDDGVVKNLDEHDAGSFLRAFPMITLYAFIGALYIDKSAKIGAFNLCIFVCISHVYLCVYALCVCVVCMWVCRFGHSSKELKGLQMWQLEGMYYICVAWACIIYMYRRKAKRCDGGGECIEIKKFRKYQIPSCKMVTYMLMYVYKVHTPYTYTQYIYTKNGRLYKALEVRHEEKFLSVPGELGQDGSL